MGFGAWVPRATATSAASLNQISFAYGNRFPHYWHQGIPIDTNGGSYAIAATNGGAVNRWQNGIPFGGAYGRVVVFINSQHLTDVPGGVTFCNGIPFNSAGQILFNQASGTATTAQNGICCLTGGIR